MMPANVLMAVSAYDRASDSMCPRGYALANAGHDTRALQAWLGHKNIQHTFDIPSFLPNGSGISGRTRTRHSLAAVTLSMERHGVGNNG